VKLKKQTFLQLAEIETVIFWLLLFCVQSYTMLFQRRLLPLYDRARWGTQPEAKFR
jgi:hypothetical protein